jgi:hypothetical protein
MPKNYDGNEGAMITQAAAKSGILNYVASSSYALNSNVKAFLFGNVKINEILNQSGCVGIRIYYGMVPNADAVMKPQLIIVGTDSYGNDMTSNGKILDLGLPCPIDCPITNAIDN